MSTLDARTPEVRSADRLDRDLFGLFALEPSPGVFDRVDDRIGRALSTWSTRRSPVRRLHTSRRAGIIGLLAAVFVAAGATGGLQSLYLFLAGPFDVPWHRGVPLNLSQVVDGYRVTIDRAYADATRLALAISVVDELERPGTTQLMAMATIVTDASGEYSGMGAGSMPDGAFAAGNVTWKVPPVLPLPSGPRRFHVVIPHIYVRDDSSPPPDAANVDWNPWKPHPGPWTFDFELTVDGGTTVTPTAVAEIDHVRVSVSRLIAASSVVRVELRAEGKLPGDGWAVVGSARHGGRVLPFVMGTTERDGTLTVVTDGGVRDASGDWTVTVDALVGSDVRLEGPWVLTFTAP